MKKLLLVLLVSSCTKPHMFMFENGATDSCRNWGFDPCGLFVEDCSSGMVYECQKNVMHIKEEKAKKCKECYGGVREKLNYLDGEEEKQILGVDF